MNIRGFSPPFCVDNKRKNTKSLVSFEVSEESNWNCFIFSCCKTCLISSLYERSLLVFHLKMNNKWIRDQHSSLLMNCYLSYYWWMENWISLYSYYKCLKCSVINACRCIIVDGEALWTAHYCSRMSRRVISWQPVKPQSLRVYQTTCTF